MNGEDERRRTDHTARLETPSVWPLEGRKDDSSKPRPELIAPEIIDELSKVLAFGAKKSADRNWELGMNWSRPFGALMRHLWSWWKGEDEDEETGLSHLSHAACCIMFLIAYESRNSGTDDRWRQNRDA